jgi:hypothetical protein
MRDYLFQLDRYRAQLSDSTRVGHELALQVKGLEAQLGSANRMSDRYKETAEELQVSSAIYASRFM